MATKDEIYRKLLERFASEPTQDLREISYNLAMSGTAVEASQLEDRARSALKSLREKRKQMESSGHDALKAQANQNEQFDLSICPVCREKMISVKLMENRPGYYCQQHRIFQPLPKQK